MCLRSLPSQHREVSIILPRWQIKNWSDTKYFYVFVKIYTLSLEVSYIQFFVVVFFFFNSSVHLF